MVAYALEIDPALLAFAPELLADLDVLGADAAPIGKALRELGLAQRSTVVDLGCCKRGVAIAAALGCQVVRRVEISQDLRSRAEPSSPAN